MRKTQLAEGEYYHIFNRGVDKREIFSDQLDRQRFFRSMDEFNTLYPIGSIYENFFRDRKEKNKSKKKLVGFVCYCLNPNHYHFILKQTAEQGIEKFMHRLGVGYTKYFNKRHDRTGSLFQGTFKAVHIKSNSYFFHLSVYVNLNSRVHSLGNLVSKSISSWREYTNDFSQKTFCTEKSVILNNFKNGKDYRKFAEESLVAIKGKKEMEKLIIE
jgi:putative transposase